MLCGIPWWWKRHSVSLPMDMLAELLWVQKASIPRIRVYSNEDDFLPSQQWKSSSVVNTLPGDCWSPWAMMPYQGSSAGLCWQIRLSATALARLALLRSTFLPRSFYSWAPWVSTHNPHCLGKEVICHPQGMLFCLFDYEEPPLLWVSFGEHSQRHIYLCSLRPFQKDHQHSSSPYFFVTSLSICFLP